MLKRVGIILDQQGSVSRLFDKDEFDGWEFHSVPTIQAASRVLVDFDCLVGIVVFTSLEAYPLHHLESLLATPDTEWLALLPPHLLAAPRLSSLVLSAFHDYHTLPIDRTRLRITLGHAYGKASARRGLRQPAVDTGDFGMVGRSTAMLEFYRQLEKVFKADAPVLLGGESGTGKELAARAIHHYSNRSSGPFIAMNCGALPPSLIQSQLFGHEKGAFTGAHDRKIGSIEAAHRGVLFLDEIGDLPLELQANLLRVLQEKSIVRVGSTRHIPVDVRVIAATHVDLRQAIEAGRFREDLYYRLNVLQIRLPPLRQRLGDIELLANSVFRDYASQKGLHVKGFSRDALEAMSRYHWPGNVRELFNRVRQAMIMSENRLINAADLGLAGAARDQQLTLAHARTRLEKSVIQDSLRQNRNNISQAARQLGVSRVTLYRMMNRLNIDL